MIDGVTSGSSSNLSNQLSNATQSALGKDDFLQLMITQMKNQDPLSPMESNDFAAQLAQFSSLEQLSNLNEAMNQSIDANYYLTQSVNNTMTATLIGKNVKLGTNVVHNTGQESVDFQYNLPSDVKSVEVEIYDKSGNLVKKLENLPNLNGEHKLSWDFTDNDGRKVNQGDYTLKIKAIDNDNEAIRAELNVWGRINGVRFSDSGTNLIVGEGEYMLSDIVEIVDPDNGVQE